MHFSTTRRRKVAATASILALSAGIAIADQAMAQTAPADASEATVVEEIVVGTRASLQSAMNRKKRAGTISDSIVAEDISQFPDKNVGEALGRITGVQLARDFGEGNAVSIRGVEPDLNRVEINGMSTLSTAGNLQVYGGGGRSNDFRELASELVQSIDVFKGFTADMTEGGVGGTVSVKTRKPLDFKKPTLSLTASAQNLDTASSWKPRGNLFAATRLLDGRLGLMANVTYDKVDTRGDYVRNTSWGRFADFDNSADKTVDYYSTAYNAQINALAKGVTSQASCNTLTTPDATQISTTNLRNACLSQWYDYAPRTARYGVWTRSDERVSAEFTAQYRFTDKIDAWVSYNRNERKNRLNDINYGTDFTSATRLRNAASATACSSTDTTASSVKVDANHNVTSYTLGNCLTTSGAGGYGGFGISARDFSNDTTSNYYSFGANYRGDRLQVEFQGSKADTSNVAQTNNVSVTFDTPGMTVSLDPATGNPSFAFASGYSPSDASAIRQWQIQYRPSNAASKEEQYKLDFDYDTRLRFIPKIEFGGRMTDFSTKGYGYGGFILNPGSNPYSTTDDTVIYSNAVNSTATILGSQAADQTNPVNASAASTTGYWSTTETWSRAFSNSVFAQAMTGLPSDFYFGGGSIPSTWNYPNFASVAQYLDTSHFNLNNLEKTTGSDGKAYSQFPYNIAEKTDAQYLKFNYEFPLAGFDVEGNFGVRRVHTETSGSGVSTRQQTYAATNGGSSTTYTIGNSLASMKKSYTVWLPSFNAGLWVIPNQLAARAGFAQLMARPRMDFLMPTVTCTTDNSPDANGEFDEPSCTAGNPELKPYRANQYDLSFEYYPNKDTQVSVGLFKKDIRSFYVSSRTLIGKRDVYGDGTLYNYNTYINGDGAKISGVEITAKTAFTFLPGILSGLGVDANYTYQKAKNVELYSQLDGSPLPFPGLSSDSANLTVWYDKGPINARLAYNYRSKYLVSAADNSGQPVYRDATGYLDGKVTWKPKQLFNLQGLSFFVEGKNLTKEEERSTAGDIRLTELGYFGRRFFVGMGLKF
ncbi:TonB-dependent receptor [Caulobacter segnis]|uniref:TonB-dependent receptor n=2 Tax=Caulobacter segnis TaxID=88688 RepID=D5VL10_CAUST|nr:TonB-dependent receptor [Caulobacter segnis]ADG11183.1 TonB-dependent receptor [Caulobacter segnis ATCC 21756]AVQ02865.1 TonB-dependent receptor [Caulobacter segnis]